MNKFNKLHLAIIMGLILTGCGSESNNRVDSSGQELVDPDESAPLQYINLSGMGFNDFNDISYEQSYAYQLNLSNNEFNSYNGIDKMFDGIQLILMDNNIQKIDIGGLSGLPNLSVIRGNSFSGGICDLASLSKLSILDLVQYSDPSGSLDYNDLSCLSSFDSLKALGLIGANIEPNTSIRFLNNSNIKNLNFYLLPFSDVTYDTLDNGNMEYIDLSGASSEEVVSLNSLSNSADSLVFLSGKGIRFSNPSALADFTAIEHLTLTLKEDYRQNQYGDWYAPNVDYSNIFENMTNLSHLDISGSSDHGLPSVITDLSSLENKPLFSLNIENTFMTINYYETEALATLTELQVLNLSSARIEDTSFIENMEKLEYLYLENTYFNGNYSFLDNLNKLKVISISINDYQIADEFDTSLLEGKEDLEHVSIYVSNSNPDRNIFNLDWIDSTPNLKHLDVNYLVTQSNISKLSGLEFNYLNLSTSNITDFNLLDEINISKDYSAKGEIVLPQGANYNEFGYYNGNVIRASYSGEFCQSWSKDEIKVTAPDPINSYCN